jgi:hypothetical protein
MVALADRFGVQIEGVADDRVAREAVVLAAVLSLVVR